MRRIGTELATLSSLPLAKAVTMLDKLGSTLVIKDTKLQTDVKTKDRVFGWNFVGLWMLKLQFLNFALSLNLASTLKSKLHFFRLKLNVQIAMQIFEIYNWNRKMKIEKRNENKKWNWGLKCSCSRVHLFVFVSFVSLLLLRKVVP